MPDLKLGKQTASYDPKLFSLSGYIGGSDVRKILPAIPDNFGQEHLIPPHDWGMLGNDRAGDCVEAAADHRTMLYNAIGGHKVPTFTDETALDLYAKLTGYDPQTGDGDNGTDMGQALEYARKTGVPDADGDLHKIAAYVGLEPGNKDHIKAAMYLFGVVEIGFEFPESAMQQFDSGKPWSVVKGARVEGGHDVIVVAERHHRLRVITWGKVQDMTWSFFEKYCDEAYAILSPEVLNQEGKSVLGFDLEQLRADLGLVR